MDRERDRDAGAISAGREPTGIPGLDEILGGGLPRRALALIVGPPGSGKTILASQIAFAAARAGRRVTMATALSEAPGKLIAHLGSLAFFDPTFLGDTVQVFSLQQALEDSLDAVADAIIDAVRQARSDLLVVDGFSGLRGAENDLQKTRQFLYRLGGTLGALGLTLVVSHEANARDSAIFPESTSADAIIGLTYELAGGRHRRGIEVVKVRGGAQLPGLHGLTLGSAGLVVYPRLEARIAAADQARPELADPQELLASMPAGMQPERAPFNVPELDALLQGGLTRGTSTVLTGSPGAGKTLLALHFALAGAHAGESTVYVSFRETARQLAAKADAFQLGAELRASVAEPRVAGRARGAGAAGKRRAGSLTLLHWEPVGLNPDIVADRLLAMVDESGASRLVVDSVLELERAILEGGERERVGDYLAALVAAARQRGISSLFVREKRQALVPAIAFSADGLAVLAENLLLLQQVAYRGQVRRVLSVLKMRFSAHDTSLREFTIAPPEGIRVMRPFESDEGLLAGIVQQREESADGFSGEDFE